MEIIDIFQILLWGGLLKSRNDREGVSEVSETHWSPRLRMSQWGLRVEDSGIGGHSSCHTCVLGWVSVSAAL